MARSIVMSQDPHELGGPERVERTLSNMQANIGYVPGFRRAHARGIAFSGHVHGDAPRPPRSRPPSTCRATRSTVAVRLSNGVGQPVLAGRSQRPRRGGVLGLAVRFELPSGDTSEWAALSMRDFPARTPRRLHRPGRRADAAACPTGCPTRCGSSRSS